MAKVSIAAMHSSLQFVAASGIGSLLDSLFPRVEASVDLPVNIAMDFIEVFAQIALGGVVTAGLISFLDDFLDFESQDPTNGIGYTLGFIYSQPHLVAKVQRIIGAYRENVDLQVSYLESMITSTTMTPAGHLTAKRNLTESTKI